MEPSEELSERYGAIEVPVGPWEEDENEDCAVYHTDAFRMFLMKILPCYKRYCHDWTICPFAHPGEKARRRDPRAINYAGIACPEMKKAGSCRRGSSCPYAHTVFEYWLHPSRYRTQMCKDGVACQRRVCFFAHSAAEVRSPNPKSSGAAGTSSTPEDLVSLEAKPGQDPGSPRSTSLTSTAGLSTTESLKPGLHDSSLSSNESRSVAAKRSSAPAPTSAAFPDKPAEMIKASDVDGAVSSLKASMAEGNVDLNQVIDLLSSLLRGAEGPAEVSATAGPRARAHAESAEAPLRAQSVPQAAARQRSQTGRSKRVQLLEPGARARQGGAAFSQQAGSTSTKSLPNQGAPSQGGLTGDREASPAIRAALRSGTLAAAISGGPATALADVTAPSLADLAGQGRAQRVRQHSAGSSVATDPPESRQASWASAPGAVDVAAAARETLQLMERQQLPSFPESEDSGELSERMHLLSMAPSQFTESGVRFGLRPAQAVPSSSRGHQHRPSQEGLTWLPGSQQQQHQLTADEAHVRAIPRDQWAAEQISLSRGGVHPPPDFLPGAQAGLRSTASLPIHQLHHPSMAGTLDSFLAGLPPSHPGQHDLGSLRTLSEAVHHQRSLPFSLESHALAQAHPLTSTGFSGQEAPLPASLLSAVAPQGEGAGCYQPYLSSMQLPQMASASQQLNTFLQDASSGQVFDATLPGPGHVWQ